MFLSRVLAHPGLAVARPRVLTGSDALERTVRWVHSSEILEIAHLLRGGELLLTGGTMLAGATEEAQRSYVRRLAAREVAGVAIETGAELPAVPGAILAEAGAAGFPVIELRRVVPFVEVAEAINGLLVNDSVARLRSVGVLSHDLSGILAEGGGVQEILDALVRHVSAAASVFDTAGRLIAAGTGPSGPEPEPADRAGGMGARITIRGVPAATLVLHPGPGADTEMLELAQERAVEALRLALLRTRPPNSRDLATSELVRVAAAGAPPQ
ncbi:MAG TPA: PucR family transcriptional regulator, partial [Streptomyces sp.]|nr:PucR family transcriptional regulator [Streptomyces sp.]